MDANSLPSSLSSFRLSRPSLRTHTTFSPRPILLQLPRLRAAGPGTAGDTDNSLSSKDEKPNPSDAAPPRPALNIKYRRRSRRQAREGQDPGGRAAVPPPKKDWKSMSLGEKAVELYVGEKGLLFWLNKLAYASIFVVIGGWILFRFVGPSLGLYQLDTPPLAPTSLFKGSS